MATILNFAIYVLLIIKVSKLEKELKYVKQLVLTTDVENDYWEEENEAEKI